MPRGTLVSAFELPVESEEQSDKTEGDGCTLTASTDHLPKSAAAHLMLPEKPRAQNENRIPSSRLQLLLMQHMLRVGRIEAILRGAGLPLAQCGPFYSPPCA